MKQEPFVKALTWKEKIDLRNASEPKHPKSASWIWFALLCGLIQVSLEILSPSARVQVAPQNKTHIDLSYIHQSKV